MIGSVWVDLLLDRTRRRAKLSGNPVIPLQARPLAPLARVANALDVGRAADADGLPAVETTQVGLTAVPVADVLAVFAAGVRAGLSAQAAQEARHRSAVGDHGYFLTGVRFAFARLPRL